MNFWHTPFIANTPMPDAPMADIRDIKPLQHVVPESSWLWALALALAVAAMVLALLIWLWRRARATTLEPPAPLPSELALHELDTLGICDAGNDEAVHAYYFSLSEILRRYLEGQFHINATDLTTEEILAAASLLETLPNAERQRLVEFLNATDKVKYARALTTQREVNHAFHLARRLVQDTAHLLPLALMAQPGPRASNLASSPTPAR